MNKQYAKAFNDKLSTFRKIAPKYNWEIVFTNPRNGQISFLKDGITIILYSTKMTVIFCGAIDPKTLYNQTMHSFIEILKDVSTVGLAKIVKPVKAAKTPSFMEQLNSMNVKPASNKPQLGLDDRFTWGMHKGEIVREVMDLNFNYFKWIEEATESFAIGFKAEVYEAYAGLKAKMSRYSRTLNYNRGS